MNKEIETEDFTKKELKKYSLSDARIAGLKAKCLVMKVEGTTDRMNYDLCKTTHQEVRSLRLNIEDTRKELKASSLEFGRKVDAEARRLTLEILPIEEHLLAQRKIVEDEKKRIEDEKREAIRLEEERIKKEEEDRIEKIRIEQEAKTEELRLAQEKIDKENARIEAEKKEIEWEKQKVIDLEEAKKKAAEQAKLDAENEAKRKEAEAKEKAEKEKQDALDKQRREQEITWKKDRDRADAEKEKIAKIVEAKAKKEREEKERLEEILKNQVICPKCKHKFQLQKEKK